MLSCIKILNLRHCVLLALATIIVFWLISIPSKDLQPARSSGKFYSVNILKRTDGSSSSKSGTTKDQPTVTNQEDLNVDLWRKLVEKGTDLVYNMRRTADDLAKQPDMNGKKESAFQVSLCPFYL